MNFLLDHILKFIFVCHSRCTIRKDKNKQFKMESISLLFWL